MALARYQRTIVDQAGNVIPNATVFVRNQITGALAPIFSDRDGLVAIDNPITTGSDGYAAFHVPGGAYRIVAVSGDFSEDHTWQAIGTAQEMDLEDVREEISSLIALGEYKPYETFAALDADVAYTGEAAIVWGDTYDLSGVYVDDAGTWTRISPWPPGGQEFILAANPGAGTANAIVATTPVPIPATAGAAQIVLPIDETNTSSPVTVAFNGGSALTIVTGSGNNIPIGGLIGGRLYAGYVDGSEFQLISDISSTAIQAAAEAAQVAAAASAAAAAEDAVETASDRAFVESKIDQATLAAIAAGAPIVTSLTDPVPANDTIEILQTVAGSQVYEVQSGSWVAVGWLGEVLFDDVAAMKATTLELEAGQLFRTRREGFGYIEDASGFIETAGAMQVLPLPDGKGNSYPLNMWGAPSGATLQAAIDSFAGPVTIVVPDVDWTLDQTIYTRRAGVKIIAGGDSILQSRTVSLNFPDGGTAFSLDADLKNTMAGSSHGEISGFRLLAGNPATSPDIMIELTGYSYGYYRNHIQVTRPNGNCYHGQGNSGLGPYFNTIWIDHLVGGIDRTQNLVLFEKGAWSSSSPGANANTLLGGGRCVLANTVVWIKSGQGNMIPFLSAENIAGAVFRFGGEAAKFSGTSTGANTQNTLNDTGATWTTNALVSDAVKITGGTGAGQIRQIGSNTATGVVINDPWQIVPDNTSEYEIYDDFAIGNKIGMARCEGISSASFVEFLEGARDNAFLAHDANSLGRIVRDRSGNSTNRVYSGGVHNFTHIFTNPGPSANINIDSRESVFGGFRMMGRYAPKYIMINASSSTLGGAATVTVDFGGSTVGGGTKTYTASISGSNRFASILPGEDDRNLLSGFSTGIHINLQTDGSWSASADVIVTVFVEQG